MLFCLSLLCSLIHNYISLSHMKDVSTTTCLQLDIHYSVVIIMNVMNLCGLHKRILNMSIFHLFDEKNPLNYTIHKCSIF
jgi:hypothetical protein